MTNEEIFKKLKDVLVNEFDVDEEIITLDANIVTDLDLDSIDAVELIVKMKPYLNGKIEPDVFKNVQTIKDVITILVPLTN